MAILRTLRFALLCLFLCISRGQASSQYCHFQNPQEPIFFCVATSTRYNTSTDATDLFVTFAYEKSEYGGWGAIGLGSGMYGALMFVTYGKESHSDGEDLLLSFVELLHFFHNRADIIYFCRPCPQRQSRQVRAPGGNIMILDEQADT